MWSAGTAPGVWSASTSSRRLSSTSSPASSPATAPPRRTTMRSAPSISSSMSEEISSTASPSRASSSIRLCTSALAPTSMPRVGSSSSSTLGSRQSQRASSTFCWLPPESSPTFCSGLEALIRSRFMKMSTTRSCWARETMPPLESRGIAASTMFSRTERPGTMPSALRSSGSMLMPARMAAAGVGRPRRLPSTVISPPSRGSAPVSAFAVSLRPEPSSPPSPSTSPAYNSTDMSCSWWRRSRPVAVRTGVRAASCPSAAKPVRPSRRTSAMSRPSIIETSCMRSSGASSPVWMWRPSRRTVTRSQMR